MSRIATIYDPPRFQSAGRRGDWFEGWFFKLVDAHAEHPLAIIPGVSRDASNGTSHAFIQLNRSGGRVRYIRYPYEAFTSDPSAFDIRIGNNRFSADGIELDVPATDDGPAVTGHIAFGELTPWPVTALSPGIMGPFRFVPRMECYHGIVSLDHELFGELRWGDEHLHFAQGRGYAEKDWGSGFPSAWVWAQSNHFVGWGDSPYRNTSLTLSVARIPWLGSSFIGHIAGLLVEGKLYRFATYTRSSLTHCATTDDGATVTIEDRAHRLCVTLTGATTGALKAPSRGAMTAHAHETLEAVVEVRLIARDGTTVFEGTGRHAGAEIMDPAEDLAVGPYPLCP